MALWKFLKTAFFGIVLLKNLKDKALLKTKDSLVSD